MNNLTHTNVDGQKTTMIMIDKCPNCGSMEISRMHHAGDFRLPECFFNQCDDCDWQWDFN